MKIHLVLAAAFVPMASCEKKNVIVVQEKPPTEAVAKMKTFETAALKGAIDQYERAPTAENAAEVRKAFAELEGEIAELQADVARKSGQDQAEAAQKLANLSAYRDAEKARFAKLPNAGPVEPVDARSGAQKVEDAARKTGEAVKDAAENVGDAMKKAVK